MTETLTAARLTLLEAVEALGRLYAPPPLPADPLALIVWENIGYLIDDQRRMRLFAEFGDRVGVDAATIASADDDVLFEIAERGGMRPEERVRRFRAIAEIVTDEAQGDLRAALTALPLAKARKLLQRFPMIGGPGADKVLLFSGVSPQPTIESNGLRVLARLGLIAEQPSYGANYKAAVALLAREGRPDARWLQAAFQLLRAHGQALCRRGAPDCLACPLDATCAHAPVSAL